MTEEQKRTSEAADHRRGDPPPRGATQSPRRWRYRSTVESTDAGDPSLLAIVETFLAVAMYAWIAYRIGTLHLTVAACLVPVLLLSTPKSREMALEAAERNRLFATMWPRLTTRPRTWYPLRLTRTSPVAPIVGLGFGIFFQYFVVVALLYRITSFVRCFVRDPADSLKELPRNWYRHVACIDVAHPPELIPGTIMRHRRFGVDGPPTLAPLDAWTTDARSARRTPLFLVYLFMVIGVVFGCVPTWIYRWSIKGTSLLLFPIAFLAWDAPRTEPAHIAASPTAVGLFGASGAILATASGALLKRFLGTDFGLLAWHVALTDAAKANPTSAAYFPARAFPTWQVLIAVGAAFVFAGYLYAWRLKNRGWSPAQKRILELGHLALGSLAVATAFSLVYVAAKLARS